MRFDTKAVHAAQPPDEQTGAVNAPIYLSSTFAQRSPNRHKGYVYGRTSNPTRTVLENLLAELEEGSTGLAFSSGLGAFATLLENLPRGSRVLAGTDLYGGSYRLFEHHRKQFGLDVEYLDLTTTAPLDEAIARNKVDLVYFETPTNPLLDLADIRAIARRTHRAGGRVCVDNTFASPALQRPLTEGADIVLHSSTKYLSGHSDVIGGALVVDDRALGERLAWLQNAVGAVPSPFDCFLILRGIHTLGVRMRAHGASAAAVLETLQRSPKVRAVYYPGDRDHPQYPLAQRQMSGFGGMMSADLANGAAARHFMKALKIFTLAESLGGVESLIDHPASMTHASVPRRVRLERGVGEGLVRFSCGIEDPADLADDVRQALKKV